MWDWNCTLLDDFHISVEAAALACAELGVTGIDADMYRRCFTRPVRRFYEVLLNRPLTEEEWTRIAVRFHESFEARQASVGLRADAVAALMLARAHGLSQSLLSLGEHDKLTKMVERHALGLFFSHVEGATVDQRTGTKSVLVERHLAQVANVRGGIPEPGSILLIGDTTDDARAALSAGLRCVLLSDGCFDAGVVDGERVVVADSLTDAVRVGLSPESSPGE